MSTSMRDKIARQLDLEDESRALGSARYRAERPLPWRKETASTSDESDLPPGRKLLKMAVDPTAEAISEWCHLIANGGAGRRHTAYRLLSSAGPREVAYTVAFFNRYETKNDKPRALPLSPAIVADLEMLRVTSTNGKLFPFKPANAWHRWDTVRDIIASRYPSLDLSDAVLHTFRHTFITRMTKLQVPMKVISKWAGHSNVKITDGRYSHLDFRDLFDTVGLIPA